MVTDKDKINLIYICGMERSGSTLLGRLMEQHEDVFFAGEVEYVWEKGFLKDQLCGCGEPFKRCRLWCEVTEDFLAKNPDFELEKTLKIHNSIRRIRSLPRLFVLRRLGIESEDLRLYLKTTRSLYESIRNVTGASYIVDSSKRSPLAYLLSLLPDSRAHVLHLVRDVRGVAYSQTKIRKWPDIVDEIEYMETRSPLHSSLSWIAINILSEYIGKSTGSYRSIRYEDLIKDTEHVLDEVFLDLGLYTSSAPAFSDKRSVNLRAGHSVSGNPQRFISDNVELKLDEEWRNNLSVFDRLLVSLISLPMLKRYSYGIF